MYVKEKLMELLRKPIFRHELADPVEAAADYLIANGVTVQEWISVEDRLPTPYVDVLVYRENFLRAGGFTTIEHVFLGHGEALMWGNDLGTSKSRVTHWIPLPEPPKEGRQ